MEKTLTKELTIEYLLKELRAYFSYLRNSMFAVAVILAVIFGLCSIATIFCLIPAVIGFCVCVVSGLKNCARLDKINKMDLQIEKLVCEKKNYTIDREENDRYGRKIYFTDGRKYEISLLHKRIYNREIIEDDFYDSINVGDWCYAVSIGKENKISCVFPCDDFCLSDKEFVKRGDLFIPVKDIA